MCLRRELFCNSYLCSHHRQNFLPSIESLGQERASCPSPTIARCLLCIDAGSWGQRRFPAPPLGTDDWCFYSSSRHSTSLAHCWGKKESFYLTPRSKPVSVLFLCSFRERKICCCFPWLKVFNSCVKNIWGSRWCFVPGPKGNTHLPHICVNERSFLRSPDLPPPIFLVSTKDRFMEKSWDECKLSVWLRLPVLNWWASHTWPLGIASLFSWFHLTHFYHSLFFFPCSSNDERGTISHCPWRNLSLFGIQLPWLPQNHSFLLGSRQVRILCTILVFLIVNYRINLLLELCTT